MGRCEELLLQAVAFISKCEFVLGGYNSDHPEHIEKFKLTKTVMTEPIKQVGRSQHAEYKAAMLVVSQVN